MSSGSIPSDSSSTSSFTLSSSALPNEGGSVTHWIQQYQQGSDEAAARLWELYFERLIRLARRRLGLTPRQTYDEEDVALSAFKSFCKGVKAGRIERDFNRDHLWKLMTTITVRKICDILKYHNSQKRNPQRLYGTRVLSADGESALIKELISREPDPGMYAELDEHFQGLLDQLVHTDLQRIAILKMEGFQNSEIARSLNRGLSTIERKLRTIRQIWQNGSQLQDLPPGRSQP